MKIENTAQSFSAILEDGDGDSTQDRVPRKRKADDEIGRTRATTHRVARTEMNDHSVSEFANADGHPYSWGTSSVPSRIYVTSLPDSVKDTKLLNEVKEHDETLSESNTSAYYDETFSEILRNQHEDIPRLETKRDFQPHTASIETQSDELLTSFDVFQDGGHDDTEYTDDDVLTEDERSLVDYSNVEEEVDYRVYHEYPVFDAEIGAWMQPEETSSARMALRWISMSSQSKPTLCGRCRWKYRDNLLLRSKHGGRSGGLTFQMQISPLKSQNADCRLCQFLSKILIATSPPGLSSDGAETFHIRIYTPRLYNSRRQNSRTTLLLVSDNHQSILALSSLHYQGSLGRWLPRITDPDSIDYESLRGIVTLCYKCQGPGCQGMVDEQLPDLKMIDCSSGKVVPAPKECQYVALSYVWGDSHSKPQRYSSIYRYPQTIIDSIHVTNEMGYQYLWVDKYVRLNPY